MFLSDSTTDTKIITIILSHTSSSCFLPTVVPGLNMPSSPESIGRVASVPKVGELRNQLGFADQSSSTSKIFNDTLRAFRRSYKTTDGIPGVKFHDWKSREHQTQLSVMVVKFLSANNGGKYFWPDEQSDGLSQSTEDSSGELNYINDQQLYVLAHKCHQPFQVITDFRAVLGRL
jgi:hypothetical protein